MNDRIDGAGELDGAGLAGGAGEPADGQTTDHADGASGPAGTSLELPAVADIRVAAEIQARCQAALDSTGDVTVSAASTERVDAAVLQCLAALANGLHQGGRSLHLAESSEAFDRAVDVLGFRRVLTGS
ncbi:MAG: STAS domain-containing protein [Actinomycetota bacterium]